MPYQKESSPWSLEWSDALSVCIPAIDDEHQRFIQLVNALNEAIISRMELDEIKKRMQAILDDAAIHFAHEEALFQEWNYPLAKEHAQKHAQITQALHEIMLRFEHSRVEYEWIEAGLQVKQALIEHVLNDDLKYRDFCCKSGVRSDEERCGRCSSTARE